jgi:hypothetical protein
MSEKSLANNTSPERYVKHRVVTESLRTDVLELSR